MFKLRQTVCPERMRAAQTCTVEERTYNIGASLKIDANCKHHTYIIQKNIKILLFIIFLFLIQSNNTILILVQQLLAS